MIEETIAEAVFSISKSRLGNYIFRDIAKKATANITPKDKEEAREWFRKEAENITKVDPRKMMKTGGAFENMNSLSANSIGKMYMFFYNAKHKDTLPYWDKFPLIFPIEFYKDSMLGINLHYLPPVIRAQLMNALYETLNNEKMNKTSKLQISYQILKNSSKFKLYGPCVKKYLFTHVKSPFQYVKPEYWDAALLLPSERFQKKSKEKVWQDSMDKIGN